ncbi:MAG: hypothetical protein RRY55_02600 [Bacteroidales bacterium]
MKNFRFIRSLIMAVLVIGTMSCAGNKEEPQLTPTPPPAGDVVKYYKGEVKIDINAPEPIIIQNQVITLTVPADEKKGLSLELKGVHIDVLGDPFDISISDVPYITPEWGTYNVSFVGDKKILFAGFDAYVKKITGTITNLKLPLEVSVIAGEALGKLPVTISINADNYIP